MATSRDIPVAHTPPGGYGGRDAAPCARRLHRSTGPRSPGPSWHLASRRRRVDGAALSKDHPVWSHVERDEQAGNRVVITGGGVVHDMVADGTYDHGVNDVMAIDFTTPIVVAASYENGVLVLRPVTSPGSRCAVGETWISSCGSTTRASLRGWNVTRTDRGENGRGDDRGDVCRVEGLDGLSQAHPDRVAGLRGVRHHAPRHRSE